MTNLNDVNCLGFTPLELAIYGGHTKVCILLCNLQTSKKLNVDLFTTLRNRHSIDYGKKLVRIKIFCVLWNVTGEAGICIAIMYTSQITFQLSYLSYCQ